MVAVGGNAARIGVWVPADCARLGLPVQLPVGPDALINGKAPGQRPSLMMPNAALVAIVESGPIPGSPVFVRWPLIDLVSAP